MAMGHDAGNPSGGRKLPREDIPLALELLDLAQGDLQKDSLLTEISRCLKRFFACDSVIIFLLESGRVRRKRHPIDSVPDDLRTISNGEEFIEEEKDLPINRLGRWMLEKAVLPSGSSFPSAGTLVTGAAGEPLKVMLAGRDGKGKQKEETLVLYPAGPFKSVVARVIELGGEDLGLLVLKSCRGDFFSREAVELFENIARFIGVSIIHHHRQQALKERVKELTCLYGIARLADNPKLNMPEIFQAAVQLLPPAFLYPKISSARIVIEGETYLSDGFKTGCSRMSSDIEGDGQKRDFVEITYSEVRPEIDEGPFLREERHLLDTVAKELRMISERFRASRDREKLQEQLRHADRLATIGQLSAGVAHELNEPLAGILGFAQLSRKAPNIPEQVEIDLNRIINASLHAREIIGKLMLFARQTPPEKTWVDLNLLVADGLYFVEARCQKSGIELVRVFGDDLPEIIADPGQIYQVLINLAVNAIQSMPEGGKLTIRTSKKAQGVQIVVEDTGEGMSNEVRKQIFTPFFTTKDVNEGTGLGLSVVEGIISSHGGSLSVKSKLGIGTRFTIYLPCKAHTRE